ncbi:MAG: cation transporter [Bryobacterales bacterium]|nr:cation transporter [Bryobacterales bacterium]
MKTAYQQARRMALTGLAVSAALAVLKITIGLAAGSSATVADGVESATDVFASGLLIVGLTIAALPADRNHPYGHGRFEILTGLAIGLVLCVTGATISYRSYEHIGHAEIPKAYAIWPLLISLGAKAALSYYKLRVAKRIHSGALAADGKNDFVDVISGFTALVALGLTLADPVRFADADPIGAVAVGGIVLFLGLQVMWETSEQLVDTMPDDTNLAELRAVAMSVAGVEYVEKIMARKTGLRWHVDMHIHVNPAMTVRDSHIVAGTVKSELRTKLAWIENVLVHIEPFEPENRIR